MRKHLTLFFLLLLFLGGTLFAKKVALEIKVDENLKTKLFSSIKSNKFGEIIFKKKVKDANTGEKSKNFPIPCRIEISKHWKYIFTIKLFDKNNTVIYGDIKVYRTNDYTDRAIVPIEITEKILELLANSEMPSITINDPSIDPENAMEYEIGNSKHPAILRIQFGNRPIR